jgi:hypothetical protein
MLCDESPEVVTAGHRSSERADPLDSSGGHHRPSVRRRPTPHAPSRVSCDGNVARRCGFNGPALLESLSWTTSVAGGSCRNRLHPCEVDTTATWPNLWRGAGSHVVVVASRPELVESITKPSDARRHTLRPRKGGGGGNPLSCIRKNWTDACLVDRARAPVTSAGQPLVVLVCARKRSRPKGGSMQAWSDGAFRCGRRLHVPRSAR